MVPTPCKHDVSSTISRLFLALVRPVALALVFSSLVPIVLVLVQFSLMPVLAKLVLVPVLPNLILVLPTLVMILSAPLALKGNSIFFVRGCPSSHHI